MNGSEIMAKAPLVTSCYAAALALMFAALSFRTLGLRRRLKIAVGDGDDQRMLRAMRVHSNFAEYVPLTLLLVFFVESQGGPRLLCHALCGCLLVGRIIHAYGLSQVNEDHRLRVTGMAMTFTPLMTSAVYLLVTFAVA